MFITLAGRDGGAYRVLVGDPKLAADILGVPAAPYAMVDVFDDIAAQLYQPDSRSHAILSRPFIWTTRRPSNVLGISPALTMRSSRMAQQKTYGYQLTVTVRGLSLLRQTQRISASSNSSGTKWPCSLTSIRSPRTLGPSTASRSTCVGRSWKEHSGASVLRHHTVDMSSPSRRS